MQLFADALAERTPSLCGPVRVLIQMSKPGVALLLLIGAACNQLHF